MIVVAMVIVQMCVTVLYEVHMTIGVCLLPAPTFLGLCHGNSSCGKVVPIVGTVEWKYTSLSVTRYHMRRNTEYFTSGRAPRVSEFTSFIAGNSNQNNKT